MEQLEIDYYGTIFTVWGDLKRGFKSNDYDAPDDKPEFDIREVYNGDDNLIELLREDVITSLTELVIEKLK